MLTEIASALQGSAIATALRQSFWVYPLVNAGHIVGLALLFGAIVPLDLRLLGVWRQLPLAAMSRILLPVAITGLVLAVTTGALLFSVRATEYIVMPAFWLKFSLIAGAIANALLLRLSLAWTVHEQSGLAGTLPRLQLAGMLSIGLWLAVIVAGRMIGYL
jgi:hypothetical protein